MRFRLPIRRRREPVPPAPLSLSEAAAIAPAVKVVGTQALRPILSAADLVRLFNWRRELSEKELLVASRIFTRMSDDELLGMSVDCAALANDPGQPQAVRRLALQVEGVAESAFGGRKPNRERIRQIPVVARALNAH